MSEITARAEAIFAELFSEKLFRQQLAYFEDIDYSETVDYINDPVEIEAIKSYLARQAVSLS